MKKRIKNIVTVLSIVSLTLAGSHLAIKADNVENAGGGHESTSVTAEVTDTTTVTTEDVLTGVLPVSAPVDASVWEAKDFDISGGNTVTGFSNQGLEKAKAMTEESVLTFPETVKEIANSAFSYAKYYPNDLPKGIVGKVRFHGGITNVGDNAFQGNPEINEVIVDDGEKIRFSQECFAPARKELNNSILPYDASNGGGDTLKKNKDFFSDVPKSSLTKLTLGVRKYEIYYRAFARTNIQNVDFSKAVRDSKIQEFSFYGSGTKTFYSGEGVTWINDAAFYESELEEVTIGPNIGNIRAYAFAENLNLKKLNFHPDAPTQIDNSAFNNCPIEGELVLNKVGQIGGAAFANSKLTKVTLPENGTWYGNGWHGGMFRGSELLETLEFVSLNRHGSRDGKTFHGLPNLKNIIFSYNNSTKMYSGEFINMKLRALELPSTVVTLSGDDFLNNTGWIDGDTKVALYRKTAPDGTYVTDNAVADGDSFVINPVLVNFEAVNQYGNPLQSELKLTTKVTRGVDVTENVEVDKTGNHANFKLGDKFNITGTDGLTLIQVDGKDYSADTEITVDPALTTEVSYGDGYKVGYRKFTLKLKVKDPKAVNPAIYDPIIIPSDPVTPATPDTSDTTGNPVNPENPVNPVNPTNPVTPVTPATEPTVTNPVEPVTQPGVEDVEEVELPSPEDSVEEDIEVEGDETPQGSKKIEEAAEEDLNIEGDEIPQGSTNLSGKKNSKVTAKTGAKAKVTKTLLAKTGGQNVMIYQVAGIFAVLLLGYGLVELTARKKREEK